MRKQKLLTPYILVLITNTVIVLGCSNKPNSESVLSSKTGSTTPPSKIEKPTPAQIKENEKEALKYYLKGLEAEKSNQISNAIKLYSKAIDLNPSQWKARHNRGMIYYQSLQYNKAISDLKLVEEQNLPWAIQSNVCLARAYGQIGKSNQAISVLKAVIPKVENPDNKAQALRSLSRLLLSEKRYSEALEYVNQAIKLANIKGIIMGDRVTLYMEMKEPDKALQDINTIVKQNKANDAIYYKRAKILISKNKVDEAINDLDRIISPRTFNRQYIKLRMEAYKKLGKSDLARKDEKILAEFDDFAKPPDNMGQSMNRGVK